MSIGVVLVHVLLSHAIEATFLKFLGMQFRSRSLSPLALRVFLPPLMYYSLGFRGRGCAIDVPTEAAPTIAFFSTFWLFVGFYNHFHLLQEVSFMRCQRYTYLYKNKCLCSTSSSIISLVPGGWLDSSTRKDFLLVEWALIQLESYWSKARHEDHYCTLMIVVPCWYGWSFKNQNWVGLLSSLGSLLDTLLYHEN